MQLQLNLGDEGYVQVKTTGRITQADFSTGEEPIEQKFGAGIYARRVLLSLEETDYIDSSGVGWLLTVHKRCREAGGTLVLHSVPALVLNMLKMLRMDLVLLIAKDAAAARTIVPGVKS